MGRGKGHYSASKRILDNRFLIIDDTILARVKHPQTNGKLEKWFGTHRKFRWDFESFQEFIDWYNNRPQGGLDFNRLETPEKAFWRKIPLEAVFGIGHRLFGL